MHSLVNKALTHSTLCYSRYNRAKKDGKKTKLLLYIVSRSVVQTHVYNWYNPYIIIIHIIIVYNIVPIIIHPLYL